MKKLFLFLILVLGASATKSQLQILDFPLKSANQQLVEDAVGDGFFVVNSRYRLRNVKEKKFYGWENKDYFGETITLGIKTHEGYLIDSRAITPWQNDANFEEYRDNKSFEPVLWQTTYRCKSDTAFSDLNIETTEFKADVYGKFQFAADTLFHKQGFLTDNSDGNKNGWLVWVLAPDSASNESDLLVYRSEIEFIAGQKAYDIKTAATAKTILGGVFVIPQVEKIGQITFYLSGIAVEKNGEWQIVRLGSAVADKNVKVDEKSKQTKKSGLTPIN
jgi:hypothetical protein